MFYLVEDISKFEKLKEERCYVDVITTNNLFHPKLTTLIGLYIRPLSHNQGYILPIDHPEGLNMSFSTISSLLSEYKQIFTPDRKYLLYYGISKNVYDLSLLHSMNTYQKVDSELYSNLQNYYSQKYPDYKDINKLIPLSKLHEMFEDRFKRMEKCIDLSLPEGYDFFNTVASNVFYLVEQQGLGVYYEEFKRLFTPREVRRNTQDNITYTYYNLYNSTGRPTNSFNSVNYAAIPKTVEHRKCFKPQNDIFVEFDFDGYHLRLLCELIDYPLTKESAHMQLAKLYYGKETITEDEYSQAKNTNFHALYGKIPEKYAFLDIFTKLDNFIKKMWEEYQTKGQITVPYSGKTFTKEVGITNPQKLMNYFMQSLESSRNIHILRNVLGHIKSMRSKVCLYTYDSVLVDVSYKDGQDIVQQIQTVLEENNKYPVKIKYSENLVF